MRSWDSPSTPATTPPRAGICSLTRELAVEYGPDVCVNAVLPGGVLTHVWEAYPSEFHEEFAQQIPAKRLGRPEDIAAAVCFLASDDAAYITGESLVVDGG